MCGALASGFVDPCIDRGLTVVDGQPLDAIGGPKLDATAVGRGLTPEASLLVAKPGYGNGPYSVTIQVRLNCPEDAISGTYVPTCSVQISSDVQSPAVRTALVIRQGFVERC